MLGDRKLIREAAVAAVTAKECAAARIAGEQIAAAGRIGLVLGGGGAKGAYQIGCWKALRESGIANFDAIAGTSVGALNAVLVAQDEFDKAESIWQNMTFGRVLGFRWYTLLAVAIRGLLIPVYLGRVIYPARAIPVLLWRAIPDCEGTSGIRDPRKVLQGALDLYSSLLTRPDTTDTFSLISLAIISLLGVSGMWLLGAPVLALLLLFIAFPLIILVVVEWASWAVSALDFLSTKLAIATNQPLKDLLSDCVDPSRLRSRIAPVFVTLASLREARRTPKNSRPPSWEKFAVTNAEIMPSQVLPEKPGWLFVPPLESTIEYVPTHFEVSKGDPVHLRELILQSAGLPEIFPARRWDGRAYVDGGTADNEPLTALANIEGLSRIIVMPLDAVKGEARIRADLVKNLESLARAQSVPLAPLLVLTPPRSLGGFLDGTLGFRAARCQALMKLGYADTIRALAMLGQPPDI